MIYRTKYAESVLTFASASSLIVNRANEFTTKELAVLSLAAADDALYLDPAQERSYATIKNIFVKKNLVSADHKFPERRPDDLENAPKYYFSRKIDSVLFDYLPGYPQNTVNTVPRGEKGFMAEVAIVAAIKAGCSEREVQFITVALKPCIEDKPEAINDAPLPVSGAKTRGMGKAR
jgi:hypothetical protein